MIKKKRVSVKVPKELYNQYISKLNFSGLLTELLENISMVDELDLSRNGENDVITNTVNGKPYRISIKDLVAYIRYVTGVNKK